MPASSAAAELVNPDADGLVGEVKIWPSHSLPGSKWRFCDGGAVSRITFSLLFSRIGTEHGVGDGSTTFNLPNYTGKFLVGFDASDGDFDDVGATGGTKIATMPTHGHALSGAPGVGSLAVSPSSHDHSITGVALDAAAGGAKFSSTGATTTGTKALSIAGAPAIGTLAVTDASGSGNNCPPFTVTRFIVKVL